MTASERAAVKQALDVATRLRDVRDRVVELLMQNQTCRSSDRLALLQAGDDGGRTNSRSSLNRVVDSKRVATLGAIRQEGTCHARRTLAGGDTVLAREWRRW